MKRRAFLQLSGAALAAGCGTPPKPGQDEPPLVEPTVDAQAFDHGLPITFDADAIPVDESVFGLPVLAGSATASGALVQTHLDQAAQRATLRVWRDSDTPGEVVLVKDIALDALRGVSTGLSKHALDGLAPATWYRYAFFVDDLARRSPIGRFRTAFPDDWVWPVTIGATTCTNPESMPYTALQQFAEQDLDLFCHLGDMVYADGSFTTEEYRAHWRAALNDPGYRSFISRQGAVSTWDDHEIDNNFDAETIDAVKLANAREMFFAHTPMAPGTEGQLWQSFRWGKSVEVIVLDCRSERQRSTRTTDRPIYIGDAQLAFLKDRLKNSPCRFKVVLNSVPMTDMLEIWGVEPDRWEGYGIQRGEVLQFIEDNDVEDVWFLSGDFHVGFVGRVQASGYHRRTWEVAVGPGGNLGNPLGFLAAREDTRESVFPAAQFPYGAGALAATTLTFDPITGTVRVRFVGADGAVLFDKKI